MNAAHLHLTINHFPIMGIIIGLLVLVAGFTLKRDHVKKTALGIFIFSALSAIPVFLTGEPAEEMVENLQGINHDQIEEHEELASGYLWAIGITGFLALITWIASSRLTKWHNLFYVLLVIISLFTIYLSQQLGTSGGKIRHPEISDTRPLQVPGSEINHEADDE